LARIEIFRPGRFTPLSGGEIVFSEGDLAAAAEAYDPAVFAAPLVVGHPKTEDPAYGWVDKLLIEDGKLVAEPKDVEASFAALVNEGRFRRVSASFFTPDAPNHPKPGTYYLRHLGFLGAAAPAVTGLKPVSFAAEDKGVVTVEFSSYEASYSMSLVAGLLRKARDFLIAQFGQDAADQALPGDDIDAVARMAPQICTTDDDAPAPAFAAPRPTTTENDVTDKEKAELAAKEAALAAGQTKLDKDRAEFAAREATARAAEDAAFLEVLVKGGQLLPAEKAPLIALFASLPAAGEISFASPQGEVKSLARDVLKKHLSALPKRVDYTERTAVVAGQTVDFASAESIADAAAVYQAEQLKLGRTVDAATAVSHVTKQRSR
jgi:hypothetical protein